MQGASECNLVSPPTEARGGKRDASASGSVQASPPGPRSESLSHLLHTPRPKVCSMRGGRVISFLNVGVTSDLVIDLAVVEFDGSVVDAVYLT